MNERTIPSKAVRRAQIEPEPHSVRWYIPLVFSLGDAIDERILAWHDRWIERTLATGTVDRDVVDRAVNAGYRAAGLREPRAIVHVASPFQVASAGAIAARLGPLITTATPSEARDAIRTAIETGRHPHIASADGAKGWTVTSTGDVPDLTRSIEAAVWAALEPSLGAQEFDHRPSVRDEVVPAKPPTPEPTIPAWLPVGFRISSMYTVLMPLIVLCGQLKRPIEQALGIQLAAKWSESLVGQEDAIEACAKGPSDLAYWAFDRFWYDVFGVEPEAESLRRSAPILAMGLSAGWSWFHRDFAIVGERPIKVLRHDERLHAIGEPAVAWADGWQVWAIHGYVVTRDLAEGRADVTFGAIASESDEQTRRRMIDVRGVDAFLDEAGDATLTVCRFQSWHSRDRGGFNHIFPAIVLAGTDRPVFARRSLCGAPQSEFLVSYGGPRQGPKGRFGPPMTPFTCNVCEDRRASNADGRLADLPTQFEGENEAEAAVRTA